VLDLTAPLKVPLGRWPSDPCHPLALSQQLAVNGSLQLASQAGVFAVNGPPGTGKTTMLRDLVAALVVERARRLATLAHPTQAFTGRTSWKTGERTRVVHIWRPELTGFEMVVASANNGAVENVTHEIPARAAVAGQWQQKAERLDYFPEIASALLTVDRDEEDDEPDRSQEDRAGWALMAARLGNKLNRGRFVDQFWYGKTSSSPTGAALGLAPEHNARDNAQRGLLSILKGFERSKPPSSWADAVAAFRRACDAASLCQAARGQAYAAVTRSVHLERELQAAQAQAAAAQQRADVARARLAEARDATRAWHDEHRRRVIVRSEHRQFRPRFLEWLASLGGAMREWRRHDLHLADQLAQAEAALSAAHTEVARLAEEAAAVDRQSAACRKAQLRKQQEAQALRAVLAEAQTQLGAQFPDQQWWEDRDHRERATLWTDPEWNRVRTEVFVEALRLHKAFLEHEPTRMRQSLQAATDLVAGNAPSDLPEETALAAWRSLLFVVPVISTTFASFARLFSHLGRESLGWLFVDEAGQATPQSTVGALWRSRRAVVVGDPLQLEPITTLPFRAEQAIRNSHGVDELWLSSRTSVQRLADRSSRLGTWLPGDEGNIWVGAPLTLHRRCDEPMFGIANRIAYGGLMIYGTGPDQASQFLERYPPHRLPMSKWVDVRSDTSEGHWKPAEGEQLDRILRALARLDFDFSQVMVIAPFRDVASQVQHRASSYNGLVAGTIHTAQGKQADIVILVLGGDPVRPGAKFWAASKPNLLNVAVSRAKRRLYVIGDRRSWGQQHYFDVLARELP